MTVALCTNCGGLKHGLLIPCDHCGALPKKEVWSEFHLSDHYLSEKTLKEFGSVIKRLSIATDNEQVARWAFLYLLSEYYPEILFADVPKAYIVSSKILLKDLDLEPIVIKKSIKKGLHSPEKMDPEDKHASVVKHYNSTCPQCGVKKSVAAWQLFNGYSDAPFKRLLFEGRLFRSRCLKCQKIQPVHYDMVYFDIEPKPVLLFLDDPRAGFEYRIERVPKEYFDELSDEFTYRKVEQPIELIEKIQIFEDGLDDIEVEFAKHMLGVELGMDVSGRLHYHEIKTGLFKKREIIFRDRKNELDMLSYSLNNRKGSELRLLTSMKKKIKQQSSEWPVVKAETLIKLLESEAKYKKYRIW